MTTTKLTSGPREHTMNKSGSGWPNWNTTRCLRIQFYSSIEQRNIRIVALPRSVSSPSTWIVLGRGFIPPADRGLAEKMLLALLERETRTTTNQNLLQKHEERKFFFTFAPITW